MTGPGIVELPSYFAAQNSAGLDLRRACAPRSSAAATIRSFSARDQRRRRCTDVITSTALAIGAVLVIVLGLASKAQLRKAASPEAYCLRWGGAFAPYFDTTSADLLNCAFDISVMASQT
jgi:hypothetical protein